MMVVALGCYAFNSSLGLIMLSLIFLSTSYAFTLLSKNQREILVLCVFIIFTGLL